MDATLAALVELQRAESEIRRLEIDLEAIPKRRAEVEAALAAEQARLDQARHTLAESQKARRTDEAQLQDLETKRSRYKGQLADVKTNREYTAMLHEIEGVERDISAVEDRILGAMEKAESLVGAVRFEEGRFAQESAAHQKVLGEIEADRKRLEQAVAHATQERDLVATRVPKDKLEMFRRIARLRGVAVSPALDGVCQQCHTKLLPQMFVDLKRNDKIFQCPECNRILHYEPPPPEVVPDL